MLIYDKSGKELRHRILLSFFVVKTTQESIAKLNLQMVISPQQRKIIKFCGVILFHLNSDGTPPPRTPPPPPPPNKTFSYMTNNEFWEIVDRIPDLAFKRNLQIRLLGNFGLQYGAPWLRKSGSSTCSLCKDGNVEDISHFLFACPKLEDEWATFWYILKEKV